MLENRAKAFVEYSRASEEFILYRRYPNGNTKEIACSINEHALDEQLKQELARPNGCEYCLVKKPMYQEKGMTCPDCGTHGTKEMAPATRYRIPHNPLSPRPVRGY